MASREGWPCPVQPGDIVAGKYRVERALGVGAMGFVVAARHTTLQQEVAIKFLLTDAFGSRDASVARFVAEARTAARLDSDHVCRVFDVGTLPNGVPFMVMERLEGSDLEVELERRKRLPIVEAVDCVLQAADAITAAARLGIVHGDLKPSNLFLALRADGSYRVKVLDFGISRGPGIDDEGLPPAFRDPRQPLRTPTASPRVDPAAMGTPSYMSPEQIYAPADIDPRTDVWALGAILYELVTGDAAFTGDTVEAVLDMVLDGQPRPMRAACREVPAELEAIVLQCLARARDKRFGSAAALAHALARFGSPGILGQLASVHRELGSRSSFHTLGITASVPPMVASVAPPVSGRSSPIDDRIPDMRSSLAPELGMRAWLGGPRRQRTLLLGMSAVFLGASVAVLAHLVTTARAPRNSSVASLAIAASHEVAIAQPATPPPAVGSTGATSATSALEAAAAANRAAGAPPTTSAPARAAAAPAASPVGLHTPTMNKPSATSVAPGRAAPSPTTSVAAGAASAGGGARGSQHPRVAAPAPHGTFTTPVRASVAAHPSPTSTVSTAPASRPSSGRTAPRVPDRKAGVSQNRTASK